jgi:hypothetical protein
VSQTRQVDAVRRNYRKSVPMMKVICSVYQCEVLSPNSIVAHQPKTYDYLGLSCIKLTQTDPFGASRWLGLCTYQSSCTMDTCRSALDFSCTATERDACHVAYFELWLVDETSTQVLLGSLHEYSVILCCCQCSEPRQESGFWWQLSP